VASLDPLAADGRVAWRRAERVLWRRTLAGVVVLPARADAVPGSEAGVPRPVALQGPAAGIWELLSVPMTHGALVTALATEYGVYEEQVATDVGGALEVLLELGALCRS
jgi:hypothetical protein